MTAPEKFWLFTPLDVPVKFSMPYGPTGALHATVALNECECGALFLNSYKHTEWHKSQDPNYDG